MSEIIARHADLVSPYACITQEVAHFTCQRMNEHRPNEALFLAAGKPTTRYVVALHDNTGDRWGIVRRWKYNDRPELGEMGGEFMRLDQMAHLSVPKAKKVFD